MEKSKTHRPPHIFVDKTYYFITLSTLYRKPYYNNDQKKSLILVALKNACLKYKFGLIAWVILDNHCHIMVKINNSKSLPIFIRSIEGKSAIELNKISGTPGVKRWYQYWDKCVDNEVGFWKRINYIHQNPVKHEYVKKMGDYKFSSYNYYLDKYGKEWMVSSFEQYPIVSFVMTDGF